MQKLKQPAEILLLAISGFLLFLLIFQNSVELPAWLKVAGRMHPMVLHFPIVLIFLSLLSWWSMPEKKFPGFTKALLLISALSASVTALMGLLLSVEETREGNAFVFHKWSGIGLAFITTVIYHTCSAFNSRVRLGRTISVIACLLLVFAGHYGAVLTHGKDYLSAPLAIGSRVQVSEAVIFDNVIKPVFQKCTGCHNADNRKGGLDLETEAGLIAGGKTGPLLKKGDPSMSLLMHRIYLPAGEKKHMPPASKPQLADDEIELLKVWISAGAPVNIKLTQLPVQDSFRIIASKFLQGGDTDANQPVYTFASADPAKIAALNTAYRVVEQLGSGSPALSVQFYGREYFTREGLKELLAVKDQVTELSLAKLPIKDEDLQIVASFINLNKLNLNYTDVTDKGLRSLLALKSLQSLSFSGTDAGSEVIADLAALPQMKRLYVWNTKIDSLRVMALRKKHPALLLETGFKDTATALMALPPPRFTTAPGILTLPASINLSHPVKGAIIRFTTDGSQPDSLSSPVFKGALALDSNITITARAFKNGWNGSSTVKGQFLKKGKRPDSIIALTQPDYRYNNGTDILIDGDLGELRYQNGQWLAYQKNDAVYELVFNKPVTAQSISVNMLENTGAQIFRAATIEVWNTSDKTGEKLLGRIKTELPRFNLPTRIFLETINFKQEDVQRLRVKIRHLEHLPAWHSGKGNPGWILVSELLVN